MNYNRAGNGDLAAYTITTGAKVSPDPVTGNVAITATTFFIPLGGQSSATVAETALAGVHLKWSAALAATITLETSNMPRFRGGADSGQDDVTDYDVTAGNWIQENPTAAVVSVSGSGNSVSALTITAGGTAAGGATIHLGNLGTARARLKVVATVGGTLRARVNGKLGS